MNKLLPILFILLVSCVSVPKQTKEAIEAIKKEDIKKIKECLDGDVSKECKKFIKNLAEDKADLNTLYVKEEVKAEHFKEESKTWRKLKAWGKWLGLLGFIIFVYVGTKTFYKKIFG